MRVRAFSLIEMMVVIAIIAILAAFLFPVLSRAHQRANEADSISNLKQCAIAIAMYLEGESVERLPSYEVAKRLLAAAPTCDRADYLRSNCAYPTSAPLIGSYAYIRGVDEQDAHWGKSDEWSALLQELPNPPIFASVYYGERQVKPFDGNARNPCLKDFSCAFPTRLLRVGLDTSVHAQNFGRNPGQGTAGNHLLFVWGAVFTTRVQP